MSHYSVAVFTAENGKTIDELLAPYEEKEVPRYVQYTKLQLIEKGKAEIKAFEETLYAEYLKDPEQYISNAPPVAINA